MRKAPSRCRSRVQRALATSSNHLSKGQGYTSPLGCPTQVRVAMTGQFQQRGFFCFVRVGMITYITKDSPCNSDVPSWQYVLKSMMRSAYFCKLGTEASAFKTWLFHAEGFKMILFSSLPSFQRRKRTVTEAEAEQSFPTERLCRMAGKVQLLDTSPGPPLAVMFCHLSVPQFPHLQSRNNVHRAVLRIE